jgi:hypothetical protein
MKEYRLIIALLEAQSKKKHFCSGGSLEELWVGRFYVQKRGVLTYLLT